LGVFVVVMVVVIVVVVHTCLFQGELSAAASEKADVAAELSGVQQAVSESKAAKAALEQEVASLRRELDEQRSAVAQSSSSSDELSARIRQLEVSALLS
jgi:septal ring factor EnvC (AmiA/AmiB activator)